MNAETAPATETQATPGPVQSGPPLAVDFEFLKRVEQESGIKVSACFQCGKCSNGCPVSFAMDYHPYQVVRFVHLGAKDKLVNSRTIWICASCQTCLTRCPNEIDIPRLMDYLKETVCAGEGSITEKNTALFHQQFLKSVKAHGRVFEGGMMNGYLIKSGGAFKPGEAIANAKLGLKMLLKHRLKFFPHRIKGKKEVRAMFKGAK
jgi:heterodisulfide reductase subunit C